MLSFWYVWNKVWLCSGLESYFKLILRGLVMEYYETPKFDHGKSTSLLFNFPFQR